MQGRNGVDQFARFTMGVALAAIVLTLFTGTRSGIGAFLDLFGTIIFTAALAAVRKSVFPEADLRKWRLNVPSVIPNL